MEITRQLDPLDEERFAIMEESIFTDIAATRPVMQFLPNLTELVLNPFDGTLFKYFILFLYEGLRSLKLILPAYPLSAAQASLFFKHLQFRSPNLTQLWLIPQYPLKAIEEPLSELLPELRHLIRFYTAPHLPSSVILGALALLPNIREIGHLSGRTGEGPIATNTELNEIQTADGFASLRFLHIFTRLRSLRGFFRSAFMPLRITAFAIDMAHVNTIADVKDFIAQISTGCPNLRSLVIGRTQDIGVIPEVWQGEHQSITYETLSAITTIRNLKQFSITYTQPIVMSNDELISLLVRCPLLTEVTLNSEPIACSGTALTLGVLSLLAQQCPWILTLKLYVDASSTSSLGDPLPIYKGLTSISLGTSTIKEPDRVAVYMSQVLPSTCELSVLPLIRSETESQLDPGVIEEMRTRRDAWKKVKEVLPLLIEVRAHEREIVVEQLSGELQRGTGG